MDRTSVYSVLTETVTTKIRNQSPCSTVMAVGLRPSDLTYPTRTIGTMIRNASHCEDEPILFQQRFDP